MQIHIALELFFNSNPGNFLPALAAEPCVFFNFITALRTEHIFYPLTVAALVDCRYNF
jgi:hypothetical protein